MAKIRHREVHPDGKETACKVEFGPHPENFLQFDSPSSSGLFQTH
jgi:hypothetical protein